MNRITVSTLGFELTREVPATTDEYNALAPKRTNPVLEDAIDNILYRNTFAAFRSSLLDKLEVSTGIARINHGTPEEPQWESDGRLFKRMVAQSGGTDVAFRAAHQVEAQTEMDAAPFSPAEREGGGGGGNLVGKRDLANAEQMIKDGKAGQVASKLGTLLNHPVDGTDAKNLARALAEYRKQVATAAEAQLAS